MSKDGTKRFEDAQFTALNTQSGGDFKAVWSNAGMLAASS
jgi:hypothetical protein